MTHTNNRIIKHKSDLLKLAEELRLYVGNLKGVGRVYQH